mmetsp:Transcript_8287/g.15077  ORF Transcript_8287/g.15077 Transcript_8287/m.15077 type:complete len:208 (-) Transcript_8287:12-635(-)
MGQKGPNKALAWPLALLGLLGATFVAQPGGPPAAQLARRRAAAASLASLFPLPARGAEGVHVVRPEDGDPQYSFDIPNKLGLKERNRLAYARDPGLKGLAAEFVSEQGVKVVSGEAPAEDFIKRKRNTVPRSRQKVLKYSVGDDEDLMEAVVKETQEDESEVLKHCWWRVLKAGSKTVIMQIDMPEEVAAAMGPPMEAVLQSFRLGG